MEIKEKTNNNMNKNFETDMENKYLENPEHINNFVPLIKVKNPFKV